MRKVFVLAIWLMAYCLMFGQRYSEELVKMSDSGNAEAQFELGYSFYMGYGIESNYKEAIDLFKMSADQGYMKAHYYLGLVYINGRGVIQNSTQAAQHWLIAANSGDLDAQYQLGLCYLNGYIGKKKNSKEALKWLQMAAEQGQYDAQTFLEMNSLQFNIKKDAQDRWYTLSSRTRRMKLGTNLFDQGKNYYKLKSEFQKNQVLASNGDLEAQYRLGMLYEFGDGVDCSYHEAFKWYKAAAEGGHADAQATLSLCYGLGLGVDRDYNEEYFWSLVAYANDTKISSSNFGTHELSNKTKKQIQERANNWFIDHQ